MIAIHTHRGIARVDLHFACGRPVAYVVRWEVRVGAEDFDGLLIGGREECGSKTYPIHGNGAEARGFAWRAALDAGKGRPPQPVIRTSYPVVSCAWRRAS